MGSSPGLSWPSGMALVTEDDLAAAQRHKRDDDDDADADVEDERGLSDEVRN
jgi:hypothetical protein